MFFIEFTFAALNDKRLDKGVIEELRERAEKAAGTTLEKMLEDALEAKKKRGEI